MAALHEAHGLAEELARQARGFRLAGDPAQTVTHAQRAIEVMSALSAKSPANKEHQRNLAIYRTELARARMKLGQTQEALVALTDVQAIMRPIIEADPVDSTYQYDLGLAHRLAAEAYHKLGRNAEAIETIDKAIAQIKQLRDLKSLRIQTKVS